MEKKWKFVIDVVIAKIVVRKNVVMNLLNLVNISISACVPFGAIAAVFQLSYLGASNCFHDCVTNDPAENRGDCCKGTCCLRWGPSWCPSGCQCSSQDVSTGTK